jgi:zinc transporter ZupT
MRGGGDALSKKHDGDYKGSKRNSLDGGGGAATNNKMRDSISRRYIAGTPQKASNIDMEKGPASPMPHRTGSRINSEENIEDINNSTAAADAWRRVYLLVIAITLHNLPEGLAVGVGYGSAGALGGGTTGKGYAGARSLAIGIALQNFPEGLAVSMPLRREGMSRWKAFFWGQLSGAVEPIGGVLGAYAVTYAQPILPIAMAFAAGAMIFVVVDQLIPEAHNDNPRHCTSGFLIGFVVMMAMDLAL